MVIENVLQLVMYVQGLISSKTVRHTWHICKVSHISVSLRNLRIHQPSCQCTAGLLPIPHLWWTSAYTLPKEEGTVGFTSIHVIIIYLNPFPQVLVSIAILFNVTMRKTFWGWSFWSLWILGCKMFWSWWCFWEISHFLTKLQGDPALNFCFPIQFLF